ncbi:MAG: SDR family NAD(P)-dependent oxidoreductase, partial [Actinomycetota bacterium]
MDGRVCVITGGTSGIGKETARALAERGARVVLINRHAEKAAAVAAEIARMATVPVEMVHGDL